MYFSFKKEIAHLETFPVFTQQEESQTQKEPKKPQDMVLRVEKMSR